MAAIAMADPYRYVHSWASHAAYSNESWALGELLKHYRRVFKRQPSCVHDAPWYECAFNKCLSTYLWPPRTCDLYSMNRINYSISHWVSCANNNSFGLWPRQVR